MLEAAETRNQLDIKMKLLNEPQTLKHDEIVSAFFVDSL